MRDLERDNHIQFMEEIFAKWFATSDHDLAARGQTLSVLFDILRQEQTPEGSLCGEHPRIFVTDTLLLQWLPSESDVTTITLDDPWQINRLLLHAICYPVNTWTPKFAAALGLALRGIRSRFEQAGTLSKEELVRSSWPKPLLEQLDWLLEDFELSLSGSRATREPVKKFPIPMLPEGSLQIIEYLAHAEPKVSDAVLEHVIRSPAFDVNAHSHTDAPLSIAISTGNLRMVKLLLERGANPHDMVKLAMQCEQPEILAFFCDRDWEDAEIALRKFLIAWGSHGIYGYASDDWDDLKQRITHFENMLRTLGTLPSVRQAALLQAVLGSSSPHPMAIGSMIQAIMQLEPGDRKHLTQILARENTAFFWHAILNEPAGTQQWLEALDSPTLFDLMNTPNSQGARILEAAAREEPETLSFWMTQMARLEPAQRASLLQAEGSVHPITQIAIHSPQRYIKADGSPYSEQRSILKLFASLLHLSPEARGPIFSNPASAVKPPSTENPDSEDSDYSTEDEDDLFMGIEHKNANILMHYIRSKPDLVPCLAMLLRDLPHPVRMRMLNDTNRRGENARNCCIGLWMSARTENPSACGWISSNIWSPASRQKSWRKKA